jgi:hypothetical protein
MTALTLLDDSQAKTRRVGECATRVFAVAPTSELIHTDLCHADFPAFNRVCKGACDLRGQWF